MRASSIWLNITYAGGWAAPWTWPNRTWTWRSSWSTATGCWPTRPSGSSTSPTTSASARRREAGLADQLHPDNLEELRALRGNLAEVFGAESTEAAVALLDRYLTDAAITAGLKTAADGVACWSFTGGRTGIAVLRTRLLTALAGQLIRHGTTRMGVCQAAPCNCVYIDRSRARTRRYCCDQCNDRASIAAYRRRQSAERN